MIHTQDADFTLHQGDVTEVLQELPDESVHCVVTSPPYWGLRDYGTGSWDGGNPNCDHRPENARRGTERRSSTLGGGVATITAQEQGANARDVCPCCGARRVDHQLGLEPTPDAYVTRMVEVFREVRRVLRSDGTCWVNLGDSYASGTGRGYPRDYMDGGAVTADGMMNDTPRFDIRAAGFKPKDLCGIPWRVAFALQADGWYLRSDIIWSKPNPIPESVTDRPTKAHEYLFLLSKSPRYFFDQEAVREPAEWRRWGDQTYSPEAEAMYGQRVKPRTKAELTPRNDGNRWNEADGRGFVPNQAGRNIRSVWEITTQPYPEAHFATYPEELVRRCILAGCPEDGTVLDPFMGSGTTAYVARAHGRRSIGIELNPDYCELAARRLQQQSLFA